MSDNTSSPPPPSPDCWNGLPEDSSRNSASSREITMGFERLGVWDPGKSQGEKVKVAQVCLTLWDPMDYTVHGILQARILESVAYPFSMESS